MVRHRARTGARRRATARSNAPTSRSRTSTSCGCATPPRRRRWRRRLSTLADQYSGRVLQTFDVGARVRRAPVGSRGARVEQRSRGRGGRGGRRRPRHDHAGAHAELGPRPHRPGPACRSTTRTRTTATAPVSPRSSSTPASCRRTPTSVARATIGVDFVNDGQNGVDCSGHGTHVAGTIGGTTYGVAKAVQIVAVRVLNCSGIGSISQVVSGINWVTAHHTPGTPAVANLSLGSGFSSSINAAVESSISSGVTYVLAAGNGNRRCVQHVAGECTARDHRRARRAQSDARASFSNFGPCVDLFAPGVGITSDWIDSTTSTKTLSGTSMASPHVAGVVARYLERAPDRDPGHRGRRGRRGRVPRGHEPGHRIATTCCSSPAWASGSRPRCRRRVVVSTRRSLPAASSTPAGSTRRCRATVRSARSATARRSTCRSPAAGRSRSTGVAAVVMNVTVDAPTDVELPDRVAVRRAPSPTSPT